MSRAEKFIQDYTRNCSNFDTYAQWPIPWLTPDQARKAVEIARKETFDKIWHWLAEYHLVNEASDDLGVRAMYVNIYQEALKRFKEQRT